MITAVQSDMFMYEWENMYIHTYIYIYIYINNDIINKAKDIFNNHINNTNNYDININVNHNNNIKNSDGMTHVNKYNEYDDICKNASTTYLIKTSNIYKTNVMDNYRYASVQWQH